MWGIDLIREDGSEGFRPKPRTFYMGDLARVFRV
jgi:hypothetical protein